LVFNSGSRTNIDLHTLHHSIPELQKERPVPTVMMNTSDAVERGIENGDFVYIETKRGRIGMYALVTDDIVRGAVEANGMGGGALGPDAWRNGNANRLTDLARYDPISGFPVYKALLCQITRADGQDRQDLSGSWEYNVDNTVEETQVATGIYLDHNATTPLAPEVQQAMVDYMEHYGNPSSIYAAGKEAHVAVENARRALAILVNCTARRLVFTGGGSESNNLAIKGVAYASDRSKNHIITSVIEHPSVLNTCKWLEGQGYSVTYLPVDEYGQVKPDDLKSAITDRTCLVTIMMANNETGSIQPISELARITHERGVIFHADGAQAVGKSLVDVEALGVDLLSMSAHKFYGPKGMGALFVRKGIMLESLISGGGQEGGLRAGTENTLGIVGMGKAAELSLNNLNNLEKLKNIRNRLEKGISNIIPEIKLNGHVNERLANTLNLVIPGVRGESLVLALDQRGIAISSGSACRAGTPEPSHALMAMGISEEDAHCSIRISLGYENTIEEIDRAIEVIEEIVHNKGAEVRFVSCR
jgi:cysteine desulfurase NifS